jgi:hypothetical protein
MAKGERNGEVTASPAEHGPSYVQLWISLARQDWGSLVVIPADRDGSTAHIANVLAGIGQRLSFGPVTAITVSTLQYGSALALADLQQHVSRERRLGGRTIRPADIQAQPNATGANTTRSSTTGPSTMDAIPAPEGPRRADASPHGAAGPNGTPGDPEPAVYDANGNGALVLVPPARLIISVPPVVTEPLALTAAEHADAVVLAVRLNRSRIAELRRSIELVGRERIMGCVLVR